MLMLLTFFPNNVKYIPQRTLPNSRETDLRTGCIWGEGEQMFQKDCFSKVTCNFQGKSTGECLQEVYNSVYKSRLVQAKVRASWPLGPPMPLLQPLPQTSPIRFYFQILSSFESFRLKIPQERNLSSTLFLRSSSAAVIFCLNNTLHGLSDEFQPAPCFSVPDALQLCEEAKLVLRVFSDSHAMALSCEPLEPAG